MRREVRVLRRAQNDLTETRDYVRRDRPAAANRLVARLLSAIGSLERMPDRGALPRDRVLRARGYRVLVVGDYLVFYRILARQVRVYRVIHGRRRFRHLL